MKLYRYYRKNKRVLEDLQTNTFFLADPKSFNDPFDCCIPTSNDLTKEIIIEGYVSLKGEKKREYYTNEIEKRISENPQWIEDMQQSLLDQNKKQRVVCLCEIPDSLLMWGHYANCHSGICVEIDVEEDYYEGDDPCCCKINYTDTLPTAFCSDIFLSKNAKFSTTIFCTKYSGWSYEKEWRLLSEKDHEPIPGRVSKIIFGLNFFDENKALQDDISNQEFLSELGKMAKGTIFVCDQEFIETKLAVFFPEKGDIGEYDISQYNKSDFIILCMASKDEKQYNIILKDIGFIIVNRSSASER